MMYQQSLYFWQEFGLDALSSDKPQIVVKANGKKYVMKDEFSVDSFEKFVTDFEADKIEAYIKSEDVPADNSGPVKVAVAKNFEELVVESEKDVLVEFYAPWCGHCKKLTPIYDELGEKMADENVEIVKMDATANDVPSGYDVRGFPTLYWLPAGTKKPVSYDGGRELDDFVKYIAEKATNELKGYDRKGKAKKTEL
jgi:protein disulfide isomerase family A protein 3